MNLEKLKETLRQAFKVSDGSDQISEEDVLLLRKLSGFVVRRRMTVPALLFLESVKPLNFVGSSIMTYFRPLLGLFFNRDEYKRLETLLEKRCSIELLMKEIEKAESDRDSSINMYAGKEVCKNG